MFKLLKKIKHSVSQVNSFSDLVKYTVRVEYLNNQALNSTEAIIEQKKDNEATENIISLTTYGKRIHDVHLVIESLCQQTIKANRVILWLDENEFSNDNLPVVLKRQKKRGLDIRFCPNYRSYKKLIPALSTFPNANIITVDDDILYPFYMVEQLLVEHKNYPNYIIGHRAHSMLTDTNSNLKPYLSWQLETQDKKPSHRIFLTTGAGTLFPSHCFPKEAIDIESFLTVCPNADDVWFNFLAIHSGVKRKKINDERGFNQNFLFIPDSQDIGLSNLNVHQNANDRQIKAVIEHFKINVNFD